MEINYKEINKNMEEIEIPPINIEELYNKIYYNLPEIHNIDELKQELIKMQENSINYIEEFKNILIEFIENIVNISDNILLSKYKDEIINTINLHPKKIIDTFIIHSYIKNNGIYRKEIIEGNDKFFLNKSYNEYIKNDANIVNYIFQFKDFWGKLNEDNKFLIKTFLLTLCFYSDKRFIIFNRYQEIKKKYYNIFEKYFNIYDTLI